MIILMLQAFALPDLPEVIIAGRFPTMASSTLTRTVVVTLVTLLLLAVVKPLDLTVAGRFTLAL
jgi:hypothetical protein